MAIRNSQGTFGRCRMWGGLENNKNLIRISVEYIVSFKILFKVVVERVIRREGVLLSKRREGVEVFAEGIFL
jgi:hypothetical protein